MNTDTDIGSRARLIFRLVAVAVFSCLVLHPINAVQRFMHFMLRPGHLPDVFFIPALRAPDVNARLRMTAMRRTVEVRPVAAYRWWRA